MSGVFWQARARLGGVGHSPARPAEAGTSLFQASWRLALLGGRPLAASLCQMRSLQISYKRAVRERSYRIGGYVQECFLCCTV